MAATRKYFALSFFFLLLLISALPAAGAPIDPASNRGIFSDSSNGRDPLTPAEQFAIQVGAYQKLPRVEKDLARLSAEGCAPFYRSEDTGGKGMWFRVYAGRYSTKKEARDAASKLIEREVIDDYMLRKWDEAGDYSLSVDPRKTDAPRLDLKSEVKSSPHIVHESHHDTKTSGTQPLEPISNGFPEPVPPANRLAKVSESPATGMPTVRLSLLDAIRYSLKGNWEISVVSYEPKQAREDIESAESVYDPLVFSDASFRRDPNLDSSVNDIVTEDEGLTRTGIRKPLKTGGSLSAYLETRYSDLNHADFERRYKNILAPTLELRQPLLNNFAGQKEQTAIKIANCGANISEEEFRQKVIEVASRVADVYWKLYLYKELMAINRQNLDMAEEVYRREAERLAEGLSLQLDVERARSNAQSRRSTLLKSREQYRIATDRLKLLLSWRQLAIDSDCEVIPVETPKVDVVAVDECAAIETALKHRPEIMKVKQDLVIRQAEEELSSHQRLPKLDAFGRYSLSGYGGSVRSAGDDMTFNDEDAWEVGIHFEWPIGNRAANSRHRKKILKRRQIDTQLKRIENYIKLDVKQILHGIASARGEIEATRLARKAAEKVVEGEFTRFEIGQTSNEELLRAQDLLAVTSRSFIRAIADYNIALHELARAQGILPDGVLIEEARR